MRLLSRYKPPCFKPIFGMSDNTLILSWLYAATGKGGYYAPVFNDLSREPGEPTYESLKRIFKAEASWELKSASSYKDFISAPSKGWQSSPGGWIIQEGRAEGATLTGHLGRLLSAANFGLIPNLKGKILFLELLSTNPERFSNELEFFLNLPGGEEIGGLALGRFVANAEISKEKLAAIIATKEELLGKPVIANLDFGHTYPITTLPYAGFASMQAEEEKFTIKGSIL